MTMAQNKNWDWFSFEYLKYSHLLQYLRIYIKRYRNRKKKKKLSQIAGVNIFSRYIMLNGRMAPFTEKPRTDVLCYTKWSCTASIDSTVHNFHICVRYVLKTPILSLRLLKWNRAKEIQKILLNQDTLIHSYLPMLYRK